MAWVGSQSRLDKSFKIGAERGQHSSLNIYATIHNWSITVHQRNLHQIIAVIHLNCHGNHLRTSDSLELVERRVFVCI